jgi:RHS repeat-associated protein
VSSARPTPYRHGLKLRLPLRGEMRTLDDVPAGALLPSLAADPMRKRAPVKHTSTPKTRVGVSRVSCHGRVRRSRVQVTDTRRARRLRAKKSCRVCATWGLDIALSMSNAGGVGALLQIADHPTGKTYLPTYDGNGNVVSLLNASSGTIAAVYEYSPYGEPLRAQTYDATIADNPWRFSTKWTDLETGLLYYGHRYYSPSQGRFLGRDPTEEKGGLHLYGFCMNNAVNRYDILGNFTPPTGYSLMESTGVDGGMLDVYYGKDGSVLAYNFVSGGPGSNDDCGIEQDDLEDMLQGLDAEIAADNQQAQIQAAADNHPGGGVILTQNGKPVGVAFSQSFTTAHGNNSTVLGAVGGSVLAVASDAYGVYTVATDLSTGSNAANTPSGGTTAGNGLEVKVNIGFEKGVADKRVVMTYIGNMQSVLDAYSTANNTTAVTITGVPQTNAIANPVGGKWVVGNSANSVAIASITGPGTINVLIASSPTVLPNGNEVGGFTVPGVGAIIGPHPGPFTFAHEVGHVIGYTSTGADSDHAVPTDTGNVMLKYSPTTGAHIDPTYYNLIHDRGTPRKHGPQ